MKDIVYLARLWDKECKWNLPQYSRCIFKMYLLFLSVWGKLCPFGFWFFFFCWRRRLGFITKILFQEGLNAEP